MAKKLTKWEKLLQTSVKDFNKMTEPELRSIVRQLNRIANQRLRRLKAKGVSTPATAAAERSGGTFTTRGKNLNELRAEYRRVANFLTSRTSTIKGFNEVKKETAETLKNSGVDINPDDLDETMRIYEQLKEQNPWIQSRGYKYAVFQEIDDIDDDIDIEEKILKMQEQLDEIYEEVNDRDAAFELSVSKYFK